MCNTGPEVLGAADLCAPAVTTALLEIGAGVRRPHSSEPGDPLGGRGSELPVLSTTAQEELVRMYQHATMVRRAVHQHRVPDTLLPQARAVLAESERLSEYLVGAVFRLVRKEVLRRARHRFGNLWAENLRPDLLSDAAACVLQAAATFDPARGPTFVLWVMETLDHQLRKQLNKAERGGTMPSSWYTAAKLGRRVLDESYERYGCEPSGEQFSRRLEELMRQQAHDALSAAERALPEPERNQLIDARLVNQGLAKVLREEVSLLRGALRHEVSLDSMMGEGTLTLLDLLAEEPVHCGDDPQTAPAALVLAAGLGDLDEQERELLLGCFGLSGGEDGSNARQVSVRHNRSEADLRVMMRRVRARLAAPHAQFAFYADPRSAYQSGRSDDSPLQALLLRRRGRRSSWYGEEQIVAELGENC